MSAKNWIESGFSFLSGAGIGAGLMYLFDPSAGDKRRQAAREAAEHAWSATGDRLSEGWHAVADKAQEYGHDIAGKAGEWTSRAGAAMSKARSNAEDYAGDAADRARSYGRSASKRARGWFQEESHPSYTGMAVTSVATLALGVGLMYLLDPSQGRRRRAYIRDRAVEAAHEAQRYAVDAGHAVSEKVEGVATKVREAVGGNSKSKSVGQPEPAPQI